MKTRNQFSMLLVVVMILFVSGGNAKANSQTTGGIKVGIAWRADLDSEFYTNVYNALKEAGVTPVPLGLVRSNDLVYTKNALSKDNMDENDILGPIYANKVKSDTYHQSNVKEIMTDIDAVVFTGGEDICPTLYSIPEAWHSIAAEKDYNATRDVSDYILMSYCINKNIPVIGICRGMQMLSVVSGGKVIQDIPTYFSLKGKAYDNTHRNKKVGKAYRDYAPHKVVVKDNNSILYKMVGTHTIENVPSWHHQAVKSVEGTNLKVTGYTTTCDEEIIEAVERTDKDFIIGIQFHPEAAIGKKMKDAANKNQYMSYPAAMKIFDVFVQAIKDPKTK